MIESRKFSSPYDPIKPLRESVAKELHPSNLGGEVVEYKYEANDDGQEETQEKSYEIRKGSVPMHSSHQDNQFLTSKFDGIAEDELEDTLLSASPNMEFRSRTGNQRLFMWRTEKNISVEDYNEISDYCDDVDQLEILHNYASHINQAMSEKNVCQLSMKKHKRRFQQSFEQSCSSSERSHSIEMGLGEDFQFDESEIDPAMPE
mmetsp:Transcript_41449/g.47804  ORF Transcript_41449/g.47804 Transcript_41449/m.47804 type:complete len:204 (+) Transcript_41449:335-946(+)|eukprot:CAMPEP_0168338290 /NCGR_PEP_ID=MMETSP0213-20121227/12745_1 /TAXON_ID=151035 /ORGANISM="Euplotes harpa, Strain FSP1.4" /LENGTH=203 /DNA_ID=CAMNT_0008344037 /DNA_START=603 /DNA_END=1214 /DNA_ORIENTATION=+